jgi:hypothetical protein
VRRKEKQPELVGKDEVVQDKDEGKQEKRGGKYTTTIHLIASGLIKLGRIQPALTLYRGVKGLKMPPEWVPPFIFM